ncbi:hypothetical protein GCM10023339_46740 [Alloalcanivorax gelatiniphagus]
MRSTASSVGGPALYAWYLHDEMLDALFDEAARNRLLRAGRRRLRKGNHLAFTRELEAWLRRHPVVALDVAIATERCGPGQLVWCELPFQWSNIAEERQAHASGQAHVRCTFRGALQLEKGSVGVHGTFSPARVTCSTANNELRGVRTQYVLGQIASARSDELELRPLAIATRLLDEAGGWPTRWRRADDGQRINPSEVAQLAHIDFSSIQPTALTAMRSVPERTVKETLARVLGEPVIPKDWGGEQSDLWTTRLRVDDRDHTAAFLLKGPAGGAYSRPMTIAMLGKNGDQLQRLASTPAEVLVLQHCHEIRPEVVAMIRSLASDFRSVRRYMVLDGYDSYSILQSEQAFD